MNMDAEFRETLGELLATSDGIYKASDGIEVVVPFEDDRAVRYVAGKHVPEAELASAHEGFRTIMGEVQTASGHRFHALLDLCVPDSHEHYGTSLLVPVSADRWVWLEQDEGLGAWVERINRDVQPEQPVALYPYRYRYLDEDLRGEDHHVGEDGWSRV